MCRSPRYTGRSFLVEVYWIIPASQAVIWHGFGQYGYATDGATKQSWALQDFPVFYTFLIQVRVHLLALYRIRKPCALALKRFTPGNPGEPKVVGYLRHRHPKRSEGSCRSTTPSFLVALGRHLRGAVCRLVLLRDLPDITAGIHEAGGSHAPGPIHRAV